MQRVYSTGHMQHPTQKLVIRVATLTLLLAIGTVLAILVAIGD